VVARFGFRGVAALLLAFVPAAANAWGAPAATGGRPPAVQIAIVSPGEGESLSGNVAWRVSVVRGKVSKVTFVVDGAKLATDSKAPFSVSLDTTELADGSHRLQAVPASASGSAVAVRVSTSNAATAVAGSQKRLYWGAWIDTHLTGGQPPWDMSAVDTFERLAGKGMSLIQFSTPFYDCHSSQCTPYRFPATLFSRIRAHGSVPFFSWASDSIPVTPTEPDFQLRDVTVGTYDKYLKEWAAAAKAWGHPFFLRFNWEMNGGWFPWGESANGNRPGDFVASWRHVHDIFTLAGATNVTWVWCPSVDLSNEYTPMAALYPGDAYVDWTCLDGYNWNEPWLTFDQVFRSSYDTLVTLAPAKPVVIGETAAREAGGSKAAWIADAMTKIATEYSQIKGLLWAEFVDEGLDWPIETSSEAQAAFATGIASPQFASNEFGSIEGRPITPLSP
jgi:hypothetical protein